MTKPTESTSILLQDGDTQSLLFKACEEGQTDLVKILLSPNTTSNFGNTPLMIASLKGHIEIVKVLLHYGALPNIQNKAGQTALFVASIQGHCEIVELLLQNGADYTIQTRQKESILHTACKKGHIEIVKLLLEQGADPNIPSENGLTPLHIACKKGHIEIVKLLLENEANLSVLGENYLTEFQGYNKESIETLKLLLNYGLDQFIRNNKIDVFDWTVYNGDAFENYEDLIRVYLDKKILPKKIYKYSELDDLNDDLKDDLKEKNIHSFYYPIKRGMFDIVKVTLTRLEKPVFRYVSPGRELSKQVYFGHSKNVKTILEYASIDINAFYTDPDEEDNMKTLLSIATTAKNKDIEIVKLLLEKGADPNIPDSYYGYTPLKDAVLNDNIEIVKLLLDKGADISGIDVCDTENVEIIKLLFDKGAELDDFNIWDTDNFEIIKFLLDKGADPNTKSSSSETILFQAVKCKNIETVKLLLDYGADPSILAFDGSSVIECNTSNEIFELLFTKM